MKAIVTKFYKIQLSIIFVCLVMTSIQTQSLAQCNTNTSVCDLSTSPTFNFVTPGPQVSTCLDFWGPNVGYIILYISQGGNLNMLINGNASTGFLDVAVFNIPPGQNPCTAIQSNSNQIGCNYASSSSGCAQFGTSFSCPSSITAPNVSAGQTLMIVVENWSGTSNSFTIQMANNANSAQVSTPNPTINPAGPFCSTAAPFQLTASLPGGSWSGPGVSANGMFNPSTAGIGSHTVSYSIGVAPCNATVTSTIQVTENPVVTATSNGPLCDGEDLQLTAQAGPGATFSWTGPNGFTSTQQNPLVPSISTNQAGVYTVTMNLGGCTNTSSTTLSINPNIIPVITAQAPVCSADNSLLLVTDVPGGVWSGDGIINTVNGVFDPSSAPIGSNVITYQLLGACGGSATTTILVKQQPVIDVLPNLTAGCAPFAVEFTNLTVPPSHQITWDFGNGEIGTDLNFEERTFTNPGCYTLTITSTTDGCTSTRSLTNLVCVIPDPVSEFYASYYTTSMFEPYFNFTNASTGADSYIWDFGNNTSSNEYHTNVTYPEQAGTYTVTLIAINDFGCRDTSFRYVTLEEELVFYVPNSFTPDGDEFNNVFKPIMTSGFDPFSYSLRIFNRWGELLFESKNHEVGWDGTFNGNLLPLGTYTWVMNFKAPSNDKKYEFSGHINIIR
jgi:trimeric autotransporter adhesin